MIADLRLAARAAARTPLVTVAALVTLALGIGATTAIFSVANAMLLRPLPVRDPYRLVTVSSETALQFGFRGGAGWSNAMWEALRARQGAFAGAFAWTVQSLDLATGGEMQPVQVLFASGDLFTTLGVEPALGRLFEPRDDVRGGGPDGPVAVIGFEAWRRRFNGAPNAIGTRINMGGVPVTIVGIAPRDFFGLDAGQRFDFAVPFGVEPLVRGSQSIVDSPRTSLLRVMLRLRDDQSIAQAQATMRAMQPDMLRALPDTPRMFAEPVVLLPAATGVSDRFRQLYERPLVIIGVVAACVLVIGCLNLANLLLARAAATRGDLGLRLALGAPRWRLVRQVVIDGGLLVGAGSAMALLGAQWGSRLLVDWLPLGAGPVELAPTLDWRVAGFGLAAALLALMLGTLLPALLVSRAAPLDVMDRARGAGRSPRAALAGGLVTAQVALSTVLVLAAELFVVTAVQLSRVPLGFDPDRLFVLTVDAREWAGDPAGRPALFQEIVDSAASLPGATLVAGSIWTPMSGGGGGGLMTDARGRQAAPARPAFNFVTPGWFATYGIPLLIGRDFTAADHARAPRVAVVNETFVKLSAGLGPPIGRGTDAGPCGNDSCTIIGVVRDARYAASPRDPAPPTIYYPLAQSAGLTPPANTRVRVTLRLASEAPPPSPGAIGAVLARLDPRLTYTVRPLAADVRASFAQERLVAVLAAVFGCVALLLAGLGIYGVTAYSVARRRPEIAVRFVLGADRRSIVRLIAGGLAVRIAVGLVVGLIAAIWLSHFVTAMLFGVAPLDPRAMVGVVAVLATAGAMAAWTPVVRALRMQPAALLRVEH